MADLSHIPDEAVTAGVENLRDWLLTVDIGLDEFERMGPLSATEVVRGVLAAALPVLNTARDAETAERLAKIWPDPFGHWAAEEAEAARAMKRALLSHLPLPDRDTERAELASLRVEVAELRRRDAEYAATLRGEQGE